MSDSLKSTESQTKQLQYGAVSIDPEALHKITARNNHKSPMQLLCFSVFAIALIFCITLRFGFYNDSNLIKGTGSLIPFCEKGPVGADWNNNLLVFGGKAKGSGNFLNYILYFDTQDAEWKKEFLPQKDKKLQPTTLWKSDGVVTGNNLYVYGGSTSYHKSTEQREMWKYDLEAKTWDNLKVKRDVNHPYVRAHCMATWGSYIILFGGKNHTGFDQNWVLKYDTREPSQGFVRYKVSGHNVPGGRQAAACGVMGDQFIIFGGRNVGGLNKKTIQGTGLAFVYYNDLWTFDLAKGSWKEVTAGDHDRKAPAEAAHLSAVIHGDKFLITGGHNAKDVLTQNWMFDFGAGKWSELKGLESRDSRCAHVGVYVKWRGADGILVFGGQHNMPDEEDVGSDLRNDLLWYNIQKNVWEVVKRNDCKAAKAYWGTK